jgi:hypothetical protein
LPVDVADEEDEGSAKMNLMSDVAAAAFVVRD